MVSRYLERPLRTEAEVKFATGPRLALPRELRTETVMLLGELARERIHQDAKWGGPAHDDEHRLNNWLFFIDRRLPRLEEIAFDRSLQNETPKDTANARRLLVEIAALALAAIESQDRLALPSDVPPLPADVEPAP